jgi:hypothetical protein
MAKLVLRDCYVVVNGTNFSDHVSSCEINMSKDEVETTNFSGSGRERVHGLQDNSFTVTFQQDFAAASVDDVLFPLWNNENEFEVEIRPRSLAVSANNPKYTGSCILLEYQPLAGDVGDLSETEVTFNVQRGTFARSTS